MKLDVIISADHIKPSALENKIAVIIDVLRATTVITNALNNGCKRVIPMLSSEESLERAASLGEHCLLGGERQAIRIPGFDLSNSPLEYTKEVVANKTLIMTTTNGTRAIKGSEEAERILIASINNAGAVAELLASLNRDVVFVNAGTYGELSLEDFICAGYIISLMEAKASVALTDIAFMAKNIYENNPDIISYVKHAAHYERLKSLGLEGDLECCMKKNILSVVPEYVQGEIII